MTALLTLRDYVLDRDDPRAPTVEQWDRMSPDERRKVVDALPAELPLDLFAPEGDLHRKTKAGSLDGLERYFQRIGRKIYLSSELGVFYPGVARFAPDVLAVLDVEPGDRMSWVVAKEGKGLDFVLEVHVAGSFAKDHDENVVRYAALGIAEYFVFDRGRQSLRGYRLPAVGAHAYRPILPQGGRYPSHVLGLDLMLQDAKLRFCLGESPLLEADEIIGKLRGMLDEVLAHKEEDERQAAEARRQAEEARLRADELERQLADERAQREEDQRRLADERAQREEDQRRLAEALAEIERLRRGG